MHLSGSETILVKALEDMEKRFGETASVWRDRAREDFEAEHLEPLRQSIRSAQHAMRNIEELLRHVARDCS